jgi:hypothetical protein
VLRQHVSRRTKEIGLRRADGGTASDAYLQVSGELLGRLSGVGPDNSCFSPLLGAGRLMTHEIFSASLGLLAVMYR